MAKASLPSLAFRMDRRVRNLLDGLHASWRLGEGDRFVDLKPYERGDPLRRIDWRYAGRTDRLAVRRFEQTRHLRAVVLYDQSASMMTPMADGGRLELIEELTSALRWVAHSGGDTLDMLPLDWDKLPQTLSLLDRRQFDLLIVLSDFWEPTAKTASLWNFCRNGGSRWHTRALGLLNPGEREVDLPLGIRLHDPDHKSAAYLADSDQQSALARKVREHIAMVSEQAQRGYCRLGWITGHDVLPGIMFLIDPLRYPLAF